MTVKSAPALKPMIKPYPSTRLKMSLQEILSADQTVNQGDVWNTQFMPHKYTVLQSDRNISKRDTFHKPT